MTAGAVAYKNQLLIMTAGAVAYKSRLLLMTAAKYAYKSQFLMLTAQAVDFNIRIIKENHILLGMVFFYLRLLGLKIFF